MKKYEIDTKTYLVAYTVASFFFLFNIMSEIIRFYLENGLYKIGSDPVIQSKMIMLLPIIIGMVFLLFIWQREINNK